MPIRQFIKKMVKKSFPKSFTNLLAEILAERTTAEGNPNENPLTAQLRDLELLRMNCKNINYELASMCNAKLPTDVVGDPGLTDPGSHPCRQADFTTTWLRYWLQQLQIPLYHQRKWWEFGYICQSLYVRGMLNEGRNGLGFGCGEEPLPSLFAARGCRILATDAPPNPSILNAWSKSGQYTTSTAALYRSHIINADAFAERVRSEPVDMNHIPAHLHGQFDYTWSTCAMEHLGSIAKGQDFVIASLDCLRPGGVAVHTTEFNFALGDETIDNWSTVLFKDYHLRALADRASKHGATLVGLDLHVGDLPLDRCIDIPPYLHNLAEHTAEYRKLWENVAAIGHLKLGIDGFPVTCLGLCLVKNR